MLQQAPRPASVPVSPYQLSGLRDQLRVETSLCLLHAEAGGPPTPECPDDVSTMKTARESF